MLNIITYTPYDKDKKLQALREFMLKLSDELNERQLPEELVIKLNVEIDKINRLAGTVKQQKSSLRKIRYRFIRILQSKSARLVFPGYYRNLWMSIGMSGIGVTLGLIFALTIDNYAFLGIGLPIGFGIGIMVGTALDENAKKEGRVLKTPFQY